MPLTRVQFLLGFFQKHLSEHLEKRTIIVFLLYRCNRLELLPKYCNVPKIKRYSLWEFSEGSVAPYFVALSQFVNVWKHFCKVCNWLTWFYFSHITSHHSVKHMNCPSISLAYVHFFFVLIQSAPFSRLLQTFESWLYISVFFLFFIVPEQHCFKMVWFKSPDIIVQAF